MEIKVGQKFLSRGDVVEIICVTGKSQNYPVIDDYGRTYSKDCLFDYRVENHDRDLKPLPVVIQEGVEFSGEQYREEFERLVKDGREFEFYNGLSWSPKKDDQFRAHAKYILIPQHTDANGNVLKVGDRVEARGYRLTIKDFEDREIARFQEGGWERLNECRLLTTRTRPLCAADLDKSPCPMLKMHDGKKSRVHADWDVDGVYPYAGGRLLTWLDLQESDHQWRPSADQPWQPCEIEEEVLV